MKNYVSCRLATYGKFMDEAFEHLSSLGIMHAEVGVKGDSEAEKLENAKTLKQKLEAVGMQSASVQGAIDLTADAPIDNFEVWCKVSELLGNDIIFLSVRGIEGQPKATYDLLKQLGDLVGRYDLKVAMETHPDLVTNGDVGRRTMQNVDHPNIGINFDTANIYYYNKETDTPTELQKVIDWVVAVHLKDTDGSYHGWCFPALGEGIVDFKKVFDMLNARGFYGPWTFEIEGVKGDEFTSDLIKGRVEKSLQHLQKLGCIEKPE